MGFAGVVASVLGIIIVTLAANGRWPAVWQAVTGGAAAPASTTVGQGAAYPNNGSTAPNAVSGNPPNVG